MTRPPGIIHLAENRIRPVRVDKYVQLMSTDSIALYEELTGVRLGYDLGPLKAALRPSGRVECALPPPRLPPGAPAPVHALFEAELRDPRPESPHHVHLATVQAEAVRSHPLRSAATQPSRDRAMRRMRPRDRRARRQAAAMKPVRTRMARDGHLLRT